MKAGDLKGLAAPFPADDIEWRVQQAGTKNERAWAKVLAYVTNRAIQDRLDDVCGPADWCNNFVAGPGGGVLCGLSINIAGEWVTKWDGSENTDFEAVKGGLSGAMKRAAVHWGIGRYLYRLEMGWANIHDGGANYQSRDKEGKYPAFKWDPPDLPVWAMPEGGSRAPRKVVEPEPSPRPKKSGTKKQGKKETDENEKKLAAEAAFNTAFEQVMESIGEDDADNIKALRRHFFKTVTEKSSAFLAMSDSTAGMNSKEVKLITAMLTKGDGMAKTAALCTDEWRTELSLPSLGVVTCAVCNETLTEAEKASCAIAKLPGYWCTKHVAAGVKKAQEAKSDKA